MYTKYSPALDKKSPQSRAHNHNTQTTHAAQAGTETRLIIGRKQPRLPSTRARLSCARCGGCIIFSHSRRAQARCIRDRRRNNNSGRPFLKLPPRAAQLIADAGFFIRLFCAARGRFNRFFRTCFLFRRTHSLIGDACTVHF